MGQYKEAIADLDAAIRLDPSPPMVYEVRGSLLITSGNYDRGMADFQTMFRLNPKDPAAQFEASRKTPLSAASLRHGEQQVQQMLRDRPAMAKSWRKGGAALSMGGAKVRRRRSA